MVCTCYSWKSSQPVKVRWPRGVPVWPQVKGSPYESTSVEILEEETLQPLDKFYSSLKQHYVLESEWLKYTELVEKYKSIEKALKEMDLKVPPPKAEENYRHLEQFWRNEGMKNLRG